MQDPVRELQSATSELLSLSLQRVSLGRPCNTSVLQSLVCNTVVIIAGAPCNPYRLFSYRLQRTLTAVLRINHLSAKSELSAHAKNLTSYNLLIHIEQADSPNPEKKNLKKNKKYYLLILPLQLCNEQREEEKEKVTLVLGGKR